jgi:hypothetical protein
MPMNGIKGWMVRASMTLAVAAMLLVAKALLVRPVHAQTVPGTGFSSLVCVLGVNGSGTYGLPNGEVELVVDDLGVTNGIGTADVTVYHGKSSSDHVVTYADSDGSGSLTCGDSVISIQ